MRRMPSRSRGFALTEVLIAMVVLATGMLAMTPAVSAAIRRGTHARKVTVAQNLAQDLLERLRAEIRYDGGLISDPAALDGWRFNFLPHSPLAAPVPACSEGELNDDFSYNHGPLVFVREPWEFTVCYSLARIAATVPVLAIETTEIRIRVSWRNASGGWSSWSLSDLLVGGEL